MHVNLCRHPAVPVAFRLPAFAPPVGTTHPMHARPYHAPDASAALILQNCHVRLAPLAIHHGFVIVFKFSDNPGIERLGHPISPLSLKDETPLCRSTLKPSKASCQMSPKRSRLPCRLTESGCPRCGISGTALSPALPPRSAPL